MAELSYTLGLDGSGFMASAGRAIGLMGSMELAMQGMERAARALGSSFNEAANMERTATAIGTITKSAQVTTQVMSDLRDLAADTPFEMSDLAPAARALLGAGTAAGTVTDQLRMLGDIAAGADTDLQGLVSVFNQVRGKGKLTAEEFQQFAERGVAGLREEIAKFKGISVENVGDALSRGLVSAKDLEGVFQRMTSSGGIAFQAMERQAQTFTGKLSTLSDAWTGLQVAFATPINDALKPIIEDATKLTETLTPAFEIVGEQIANAISSAREFMASLQQGTPMVEALGDAFGNLFATLGEFAMIPLGALKDGMPEIGAAFLLSMQPVGEWLHARLIQAAYAFGGVLSEMANDAAKVMSGIGNNAMNDLMKSIPDMTGIMRLGADSMFPRSDNADLNDTLSQKADAAGKQASEVSLTSQLNQSTDLFAEGMSEIMDGLSSRLDAFLSGGSSEASSTAIADAISSSFLDRLASAAATPTMLSVPAGTQSNAPAGSLQSEAALNRLDAILGELNRLRTE
jgi:tape measure domain-containing protein